MSPRTLRSRPGPVVAALVLALVAVTAPAARAAHFVDEGSGCYTCHTLDSSEGDVNTSYINGISRTMSLVKAFNGGVVPATIGCTYCHNNPANATMRDALSHFGAKPSKHPVGRNFVTGAETNSEYLTAIGSSTANELDCVDCHDAALLDGVGSAQHVGHVLPGTGGRANNPFMLKGVTAPGQLDVLCRSCHGSSAAPFKGRDLRVSSHADALAAPIREDDATSLRTSSGAAQCTACHDSHYSAKVRLFNDGHEGDTAIVSADCTTVCHFAGDAAGSYATRGHGRAQSTYKYKGGAVDYGAGASPIGMALTCTACHVPLDTSDTSTSRKPHVESPASGTPQERYQARFNLTLPVQQFDTGSVYGNPQSGVCYPCHSAYEAHQAAGGLQVGCQDCHDEHAEGSGTAANYFMIPEAAKGNGSYVPWGRAKAGAEAVIYNLPRRDPATGTLNTGSEDFYSPGATGICDNVECHGASGYAPLAAYGTHSGGALAAGSDCGGCHRHNGDPAGGWRATGACNDCHAANGATHAAAQGKNATTHNVRHGAASAYIGACSDCHGNAGPGSPDHNNGTVNFGGTFMTAAFNFPRGGNFSDAACATAANGCHGADAGEWAANSLGADACVSCHLAAGKALARAPASGLHAVAAITRHDATLQSGNCVNCHDAAAPSSAHVNGTLDTPATAVFGFAANVVAYDASGCRASAGCHGGGDAGTWRRRWVGVVDAVPGTAGNDTPGQPACQNCHGDFSGWRWDEAGVTTTDHTDPYAGNTGDRMAEHAACQTCHGWGDPAYDRSWKSGKHGNGLIDLNGPDATHGTAAGAQYNDDTGGCMNACHTGAFALRTASGWTATYGNYGTGDCSSCHKPGGSGPTVVWPAGNAAGRRTGYGSHLGATTAEEADAFLGGLGTTWKDQCNKCHDFHSGTIKTPAPPASWADPSGRLPGADMRSRLGLTYANEAGVAVHLGGTAQGGTSEAEFCWGCHDRNNVSEWGFNTKSTPAGYPVALFPTQHDGSQESFDFGWLYTSAAHTTKTSDWTQGYWQDEYDPLTAKRIASVHSGSFDPAGQSSSVAANVDAAGKVNRTSPTLEPKAQVRCSNCHDVHDTFGPDGKPYLRGRWVSNPYPPELPPRSGYAYTTGANVSYNTPRGRSTARDKGGYFIDQNSNAPTANAAMDTVQETAELCTLCHGSDVNGMDFYTGKKLWLPSMVNGHSNSTLGGTGASKVDLFTGNRYGAGMGMQYYAGGNPYACDCGGWPGCCDTTYPLATWMDGCCDTQPVIYNSGWFGGPVGTFAAGGGDFTNWYGTGTIGGGSGTGTMAHTFTCSKCHGPHASGMPALLTHSCIDPAQGDYTINGQSGVNLIANNCHRKTSTADGWHVLAPGW
jgi:hypothetical protein